jgi:hypothetical protein
MDSCSIWRATCGKMRGGKRVNAPGDDHLAEASHVNKRNNLKSNPWSWATPIALFVAAFAAYSSTLTRWYTYDSVSYALQVRTFTETGNPSYLCHPHHILFNGMGLLFWRLMKVLGSTATPLAALQHMNAFWGAVGIALVYIVVSRGGIRLFRPKQPPYAAGHILGLGAALALACGFGYWTCATDGRVNMPGLVIIVLNVGLLWGMLDSPSMVQCGAAAGAAVLAVGLHQSHGLLAIAAIGTIFMTPKPFVQRLGYALMYTALFAGGVAAMYLTACLVAQGLRSVAELRHWSLSYAEDGRWWSFDIRNNLPSDVQALVHSFISSKSKDAGAATSETFRRFLAISSATAALMPGLHSCRLLHRATRVSMQPSFYDSRRAKIGILALVMIPYAAFFTVWNPGYFVFWMPMAVAIVLWLPMACGGLRSWRIAGATLLFVCAAYMLSTNLRSSILPRTDWKHNPVLSLCDVLKKNSKKGDLVLVTGMSDLAVAETYIPYFTPLELDSLNIEMKDHGAKGAIDIMHTAVQNTLAKGHQVILLDEFENQSAWRAIIRRYNAPPNTKDLILSGCRTRYLFTVRQTRVFGLIPKQTPPR